MNEKKPDTLGHISLHGMIEDNKAAAEKAIETLINLPAGAPFVQAVGRARRYNVQAAVDSLHWICKAVAEDADSDQTANFIAGHAQAALIALGSDWPGSERVVPLSLAQPRGAQEPEPTVTLTRDQLLELVPSNPTDSPEDDEEITAFNNGEQNIINEVRAAIDRLFAPAAEQQPGTLLADQDLDLSWDKAPEWAEWLAQDYHGPWTWFQRKPKPTSHCFTPAFGPADRWLFAGAGLQNPNWRQTLTRNPNKCPHTEIEHGYGYAAGTLGAYSYCEECGKLLSHTPETDDQGVQAVEVDPGRSICAEMFPACGCCPDGCKDIGECRNAKENPPIGGREL